jgi:ABC-type amino acid transport substrate-binding protein
MKTALTTFAVSFLLSLPVWSQTQQEKFRFLGYEFEPYYYKEEGSSRIQGALYELMEQICRRERLECEFIIAPYKTVFAKAEEGLIHAAGPFVRNIQHEKHFYFSEKLFSTGYGFYGLQKNIAGIKTYDELFGLGIGVLSPSSTANSLEKFAGLLRRRVQIHPEQDLQITLKKASEDVYPLAYANRDVAKAWVNRHKLPLHEVTGLGENVDYRIIFSKKSISPDLFARFQKQISLLKKENTLTLIANKHQLQVSGELQAKNLDLDTLTR